MKRKKNPYLDRAFVEFFKKYLLWVKLSLIGILGAAIISSRDLTKNQTLVRHPLSLVNGHKLELYSDRTDMYLDSFNSATPLNPPPKLKSNKKLR
ncbi:MAG: hypothetical protein AAGE84_28840 [Cyanobacteria bacterium P01_G01_bin.39]